MGCGCAKKKKAVPTNRIKGNQPKIKSKSLPLISIPKKKKDSSKTR